jgi:hypothetical protein
MRVWTFNIEIYEGNDEFWEGHHYDGTEPRGYATTEEVEELIKDCLGTAGLLCNDTYRDYTIKCVKFTNEDKLT